MPRPKITSQMTTSQVARQLGMKVNRLVRWINRGAFPPPTYINDNGVRYFDQEWLGKTKEIAERKMVGKKMDEA
jgi:DNA-binding transcriptional MerR regulator